MQLVAESTSLIIRGNWNPAILQPAWIARHALEKDADRVPVSMEFSAVAGVPPRFLLEELKFAPSFDTLSIAPSRTDEQSLNRLEEVAQNVLQYLPHTPISAFGQNFEFIEETPGDAVLTLFEIGDRLAERMTSDVDIVKTDISSSLQLENRVLNLKRTLDRDGSFHLAMNFHYVTESASKAVELLENSAVQNYQIAQEIADIYSNLGR